MKHQIATAAFLPAFADYVYQQRDAIGREWMGIVRASPDMPDALHISQEALQDHVPELIGDLVSHLRLAKEGPENEASDHSRSHGREQWKAGYNISELIWEIYIIKRVLKQSVLVAFARDHPEYSATECATAETLISDFFHRLTCNSVDQFIREQQRVVQEKNAALEQTNLARERLTRTVSHELRNVLNALTMATTMLGEEATAEERREMSAICARMLADMSTILNDLLDFSALVAGRAELALGRLSLPKLCEEIVSQWRPVAAEQGLTFKWQCDATLGEIVSDKLKLRRIAGNLLSNAIKYRKPARGGSVDVSFSADGSQRWKMVVADTGVGIAREDMELLFGEFNRIRPSSAVDGTGLGLAICKEYAELLGGRIEVFSEPEQSTRFEVTLPTELEAVAGENIRSSVLAI
jgi:signal transduction histidine kinase